MNCPECKTEIPADAAFCPNCGWRANAPSAGMPTYSGLATIAPMREAARASALETGTRFAERYDVIRKIGEGGMGVVYLAKDVNTGEEIVLKLIHPDLVTGEAAVKRLMAEGLTARQIRHPNIVAVYDVSQYDKQPYFTMEYVRGGTLRSWLVSGIAGEREVSLKTATGIVKTMLAGLAEAHRMGVVHRDLKPENVLLAGNPDQGNFNLKILDFGIAKAIGGATQTRSGGPVGTPIYMAPEQMTSAETVGPAADLYSLSAMFYELLMDAPPQGRWEPVSKYRTDVPPAVDALLEKGLSVRARSRFTSAQDYGVALDRALAAPVIVDNGGNVKPPPVIHEEKKKPWYQYQGYWAVATKKQKVLILTGTALLGIVTYAMANSGSGSDPFSDPMFDDAVDNSGFVQPPDGPGGNSGGNTGPGPNQGGNAFNLAGYWMDSFGNRFEVTHQGTSFTATGNVVGYGRVQVTGTIGPNSADFRVTTPVGTMGGTGNVFQDPSGRWHMNYTLQDGTQSQFHMNHTH